MSFNVSTFNSQIQNGLAREAHFDILLTPPSNTLISAANMQFMCSLAQKPSKQVDVGSIARFGFGVETPYAKNVSFPSLYLNFYCDANGNTISSLESWINLVMPSFTGTNAMFVSYPDSYKGSATLTQYNQSGNSVLTTTFVDAFPISIGPINYAWAATDSLLLVPVTLAYTYYTSNNTSTSSITNIVNTISNLV